MHPIIREFRASLPAILEGRDPIDLFGEDWYLARLRSYQPDGLIAEPAKDESTK
jgi:hypothetical protein